MLLTSGDEVILSDKHVSRGASSFFLRSVPLQDATTRTNVVWCIPVPKGGGVLVVAAVLYKAP